MFGTGTSGSAKKKHYTFFVRKGIVPPFPLESFGFAHTHTQCRAEIFPAGTVAL